MFLASENEVWGKILFSQACVSHSIHRRGEGGGERRGSLSVGVFLAETTLDRDLPGQRPQPPPPVWWRAGGPHPTGMHSCCKISINSNICCTSVLHSWPLISVRKNDINNYIHYGDLYLCWKNNLCYEVIFKIYLLKTFLLMIYVRF